MLNTKFDLYNTEWLDVVFTDRNKEYGAYELRNSYSSTMAKAMGHTFGTVAFLCTVAFIIARYTPIEDVVKMIPVKMDDKVIKIILPEKIAQPKQPKQSTPAKQLPATSTTKLTSFVVTKQTVTEEPPIIDQIKGDIGSTTTKGVDGPALAPPADGPVGPPAAPPSTGNELVPFESLEAMPEPMGGFDAFSKFLGKNMHFPSQAEDAGVSGKVIVSFVVEKNGELSNITIVKGAGYGFDQEAARVLKLAKAWKPGKQNGQPVRVRYQIPINFQLPVE
ncbi:energy transducer TonB [Mucilaginibacter terrenus]|uniref:Energy transducer TonB n=1 Tax=Mucilaginibacter terrenus TaxID=2482727 RepID=A0A3E2NVB6_9SPHI|nr:energy transducer TonB [Mucilaginibacter terrenus]RFZ84942.1 energy transducer TonB [Mucilaginibacter terrenus]